MFNWTIIGTWVAGFFTLSLFSFLYKDNPFYRFAEHVFAGLSAGYYIGLIYHSVILAQLVQPIEEHWAAAATGPDVGHHIMKVAFLLFAGFMGVLMFARFFPKVSWISRYPLAFVMGNTAGIELMSRLHGMVLPQMRATFVDLNASFGNVVLNLIILVGVLTTLIYFYFSKEHKGVLGVTARVGIWFIMIAFGAHFGYTVMARVSLLIGQVNFIFIDWLKIIS
jgi:hypothetical protein